MFVNIETERLLLRCIDHSDREFIFEEFQNDFINQYLFDAEPMTDIREADSLIDFFNMKESRNQNRWVLINKLDNTRMGTCGFHHWERGKNKVEIGFELMRQYNGQGYVTEAVEAIIEFARIVMKADTIVAFVYVDNSKCKKLLEKFGFTIVGKEEFVFRGNVFVHDVYELELSTKIKF